MENNNKNNGFQYTYSAKEQAELKRIRDKYTAPTESEDKMARLRRLDASVNNTAKRSSGAVSFMDLYNLTTGLIGQNGRRK